jgi:hypothetical protein
MHPSCLVGHAGLSTSLRVCLNRLPGMPQAERRQPLTGNPAADIMADR